MAQKRMFDRAVIETDNFLNVSLTAKALYFLLGMEADDEGFVSPNRVMRLYGTEFGDLKNLIDTGLIIPFPTGVVVITDWKQNNWLDSRRIRPTQYQQEKKMLQLLPNNRYMLSECSAPAQLVESSIEEKRRERTATQSVASPSKLFFSSKDEQNRIISEMIQNGGNEIVIKREIQKFISYWKEKNKSGTKERWQGEKYFDLKRRIGTWIANSERFNKEGNKKSDLSNLHGEALGKHSRGF